MSKNIRNVISAKTEYIPSQFYNANEKTAGAVIGKTREKKGNRMQLKIFAGILTGLALTTTCNVLAGGYSLGYTVRVDDAVVGTVAAKSEYYEVLDEVKTEVKDLADREFEAAGEETFQVEIVKRSELTDKEELAENLKATCEDMVPAAVITVGGEFLGAVTEEYEAYHLLERYLSGIVGGQENLTAEFAEGVSVTNSFVPQETVKTPDEVYEALLMGKGTEHIVLAGETAESIAAVYHTTPETILSANDIAAVEEGMILSIYTGEPLFAIQTVEHIDGEYEIPYETVQVKAPDLYKGRTEVQTKGIPGKGIRNAYITRINGEIVEENVVMDEVLKEPERQVERVGTKKAPSSVGTGSFAMPANGKLTSSYGARWGRTHAGIDIGAKTGTPIYAADHGIVTVSEYKNNGYGMIVTIDHGNGFVTHYAHCSELLVKAGDVVAKGDLIAKVGNTGRSTGPHLHFEIRLEGVAQNPMKYVK